MPTKGSFKYDEKKNCEDIYCFKPVSANKVLIPIDSVYCVLILGSVKSTVDVVKSSINASVVLTQTENLGKSKITSNNLKS